MDKLNVFFSSSMLMLYQSVRNSSVIAKLINSSEVGVSFIASEDIKF
jgi:hypothetical protein